MTYRAIALVLLCLGSAAAGPEEALRAESLFRSGRDAFQRGDYETACPRLAESQRLEPAAGTVLALALCYEAWGKNATAWALFQEAEAMARVQGRADRIAIARQRAAALEAGLSFLTIRLDPATPLAIEVSLDGLRVGQAALGVQAAVNVGAHQIEAKVDGEVYFSRVVQLSPKESLDIVIPAPLAKRTEAPATHSDARPLSDTPPTLVGDVPSARRDDSELGVPGRSEPLRRSRLERDLSRAVLGVGLVSLFAGAYFGVRAWHESNKVDRSCPSDPCHPALERVQETAERDAMLANWLIGSGVIVTGVGTFLWFRSASPARTSRSTFQVGAGPSGGRVAWSGRF